MFPRPTLTDPFGAGGLRGLPRSSCSAPPALAALQDLPDLLGHLRVASIGLLRLCRDTNTEPAVRVGFDSPD